MKAFVTGATGFIGQRLVNKLLEKGYDVTALVRNISHIFPENVKVVKGDILSPDTFKNAGIGCDVLYHLAALINFDNKVKDEMIKVNAQGTANILQLASSWGVSCSVVVSSACTIGLSYFPDNVLDEDAGYNDALVRRNPYMQSKIMAEKEALRAADSQHVVIVNPTTVYGPGDFRLNSGTLISQVLKSRLLPVPPGGGNVVDVDDVVDGIILAAEKGESGNRYILGNENLLFSRIFSVVAELSQHHPVIVPLPHWMKQPLGITAGIAGRFMGSRFVTRQIVEDMFCFKYYTSRRAMNELGWAPKYSFRQSIERALEFYREEGIL